ncbi:hypothetical protein EXU85_20615 [Spirosoma sp. KCTC 42546]|uniref:hypothetical protein n=1 Tax=Spirosoma sp. KCTC 42546 TaxID=2520506 RepID=UPI001159EEC7|nr:hypothetical protein [Spirosoma sp. KCTC 42546]QDK80884.1 hypothetical protein EXU85_20615 [Spirosoma sp. KCTC 42546]
MSLFIFFAIVLGIIAFQIISAQRDYARKQAKLAAEETPSPDPASESEPITSKLVAGQYTITPLESLAPGLKPKHPRKTKPLT